MSLIFTNGCFDIIHFGHLEILTKSKDLGGKLIVAINSDESVKKLKGEKTIIFVSHQTNPLKYCDKIIDLK